MQKEWFYSYNMKFVNNIANDTTDNIADSIFFHLKYK